MDLIAEILENYPAFFEQPQLEMLWKSISSPWGVEILRSFDAESVQLARIIVAYAQTFLTSKVLYNQPDFERHQQIMCKFLQILRLR